MKRILKNTAIALFIAALAAASLPSEVWSWCWIRETGITDVNCNPGSTFQTDCCAGAPRIWTGDSMNYSISNSTDALLRINVAAGMQKWNDIAMSTFTFIPQGQTPLYDYNLNDGTNLVNIDASFCAHFGLCGMGILGFSGTSTTGTGGTYRASQSDIILNGEEYRWLGDGGVEVGSGSHGTFNTIAVVAHEGGHSAGLSHAGSNCQNMGSSGCGANFNDATMYYSYSSGSGDGSQKASLELDDIAALVYGYPSSTYRVKVVNELTAALENATVVLEGAAAPVNGTSIAGGGTVKGDVTNLAVLEGNEESSPTYINASPFNNSNALGYTNYINPTHPVFTIYAYFNGRRGPLAVNPVGAGTTEGTVVVDSTTDDVVGPTITVTSHTNNQEVGPPALINLAGTVTDNMVGGSGVDSIKVNGVDAITDPALPVAGIAPATWSRDNVALVRGDNNINLVAVDSFIRPATNNQTINIVYDDIAPLATSSSPANGSTNAGVANSIAVWFNDEMTAGTINTATFTLNNGATGTVTYNAQYKVAVFAPSPALLANTAYTATVTTGVKDNVGNAMAAPYSFTFTTGAAPAGLVPAEGGGGGGGGGCFIEAAE